jgi:thiol-disulfide isomerase/thioredoxin
VIVPVSVEDVTVDDVVLRRIVLRGEEGSLAMDVDPETKLIRSMVHEVTGGHTVQPGTRRVTTYVIENKTEGIPEALAFDPGSRQRVDLLAALLPRPQAPEGGGGGGGIAMPAEGPLIGKPAPPFILATATGDAVDLDDLRGRVVVLDFWATWCAPCRAALPKLHDVAAWARQRGLPVEFLTINVWESRDPAKDTPDDRLKSVRAFWQNAGYTLPVAMDYTDETAAAYGVQGIPATFVIRADGIVHAKPVPDVDLLKQAIEAAIEAAPPPPGDGA